MGISAQMNVRPLQFFFTTLAFLLLSALDSLMAETIPVRHIEGTTLGFLEIHDESGTPIAYGDSQQVVKKAYVMDDLKFRFKDGSLYEEITKFTQRGVFQLLSDQVVQRGPSFKEQLESLVDVRTGTVTVRSIKNGKEKKITKHVEIPPDVANGLLLIIAKNLDPSAPKTVVTMIAGSSGPQIVKVNYSPQPEKIFYVGPLSYKAQEHLLKIEITGVKGKIAPIAGKQPEDIHLWLAKSESPTFLKFRGQMYHDGPIWEIELSAPRERDSQAGAGK